ncbi:sorbosone dehydrogenase family protein [Shewanella sp. NIFS-20-20]|uniref:PQQ-dependent sugar dehydrogenase n=1 Tax=Shewanella sp. NIFS-20-20 TaxID=2853806 RepID=UPI001C43E1AB|nr:PQQ-dependent sugar dehydrogenase [Shewanella sp. NIFS-20-20]MBV7317047.1 PQQ-dependent sugar dehydrogenase [Shewanella sp. NIFS-20-20]
MTDKLPSLTWVHCLMVLLVSVANFSHAADSVVLTVSKGFGISLYASDVGDAKQLAMGDDGTLFVGSDIEGTIVALRDENNDGRVDKRYTIGRHLNSPQALAFVKGDLYVALADGIVKYSQIEQRLKRPGRPKAVFTTLQDFGDSIVRSMAVGPDGLLYLALGAGCNVCEPQAPLGSILAMNVDTGAIKQVATGVRYVGGMDWSPAQQLWFSDNGRDWMGDNLPPDEINVMTHTGYHFGFPYIHGQDIKEASYQQPQQLTINVPEYLLPAHVSPMGLHFYQGAQFPLEYHQQLFVAENGSRNRSSKVGYQLVVLLSDGEHIVDRQTVVNFMDGEFAVGRPYSIVTAPDGAMFISDDLKGNIYRLYYKGSELE